MAKWERRNLYIVIVILIIIAIAGIFWLVHNKNEEEQSKYPRWVGISEDGKWKAILAKDKNSSTNDYFGKLYWKGNKGKEKNTYLTFVQFRVDGKYQSGDKKERTSKKEQIISDPDVTGFAAFEPYKSINNKNLVVYLHWKQNNQMHKTKIKLKKITGDNV